ncbi:MAG: zinc ribbon domain-containing protein [Parachlamydiaceae bacterium]|nr:zinc ribbon domain-containing protein [Parachlamydiaceae bacterium]
MPTYGYLCSKCSKETEKLQKMSDEPLKTCPHCSGETLKRLPGGGGGLSFSGSGFYITDYGSPNKGPKDGGEGSGGCCPCGKGGSCKS